MAYPTSPTIVAEDITTCDVLVIGAGPGGGNAALHSARKGLKTILIEDHPEIGTPVHCGECISDIACDNLKLDLPPHVISKRVHGIRVIFPDGTAKETHRGRLRFGKASFRALDCRRSSSEGAQLHLSHKLRSMDKQYDEW